MLTTTPLTGPQTAIIRTADGRIQVTATSENEAAELVHGISLMDGWSIEFAPQGWTPDETECKECNNPIDDPERYETAELLDKDYPVLCTTCSYYYGDEYDGRF